MLLEQARAAYAEGEYEEVLTYVAEVLRRPDLSVQQNVDAYVLQGSALAVVKDPVFAETPFRLALRTNPELDLPDNTPPKILAVFRKVLVEERRLREQMLAQQRQRLIDSLSLSAQLPAEATGGYPLLLTYQLQDPQGAVEQMKVEYRRRGEAAYSALALRSDGVGGWQGEIPGEWTENEGGQVMEYYVSTLDVRSEPLLQLGRRDAPLSLDIAPGTVDDTRPFYRSPWFWTLSGLATLAVGVVSFFAIRNATELPNGDLGSQRVE